MTMLLGATTYYVRAYATNNTGTGYGTNLMFQTLGQAPTAITVTATNVTSTSSTLNGIVNANYLSTTVSFEYGATTSYGKTATSIQSPLTGNANANVSVIVTELTAGTTYHYRVKAVNSKGTTYGSDMTFITSFGIGQLYGGGNIFYIDGSGEHGLIAAPVDQSNGVKWSNLICVKTNALDGTISTGQVNTTKIVTIEGAGNYAAKICDDLVLNGYSDWFLPSSGELGAMSDMWFQKGIGNFSPALYWSSTEIDSSPNPRSCYAIIRRFDSPDIGIMGKDYTNGYVRAIRAF